MIVLLPDARNQLFRSCSVLESFLRMNDPSSLDHGPNGLKSWNLSDLIFMMASQVFACHTL